ncbi:uncharacterized protein BDZ99DRAFT_481217 [Mytilinidion resinicola]|uniref:C2H2-type domain-containing protein n=1 Tax=Mytilinidion resinicola TaxID=574789 RepID=A0A6A6Y788_9PEZI|nr:uncharacterized protein BDZ99DRAFT_481217 [Mytilinidion resinicola]KAF2804393.1 hypothetical protein BDZ99DRAFT_481217 [Mytilinidion resinicola]
MLPSYDTSRRTVTNTPSSKAIRPTQTMPLSHTTSVPYQPGGFTFNPSVNPYNMMDYPMVHTVAYSGTRTPPVKPEATSPTHLGLNDASSADNCSSVNFPVDNDVLIKVIQAKPKPAQRQRDPSKVLPPNQPLVASPVAHQLAKPSSDIEKQKPRQRSKGIYQCSMSDCYKIFSRKSHLEIHTRGHNGVKPFLCKEPSCGHRCSQLGNLKTHERIHTGERPYDCDICGKTFAQRSNVQSHKIVHLQIKPYTCRFDNCDRQYTQLPNL